MFIVIHCAGMPFNGNTIKERSLGGSETAAYYLAKELAAKGNQVTMFTNSKDEGIWDGVKYIHAGTVTEAQPLGDRFHYYAEGTPHDIMIIQRHPAAFRFQWASKINLWWVHDLAIARSTDMVTSQLWNVDGILTVSEFHKQQYVEVYGINPDIIFPIQNGIDLDLYNDEAYQHLSSFLNSPTMIAKARLVKQVPDGEEDYSVRVGLLYSSRPERGLEHLVAHNGIMERLAKIDSKYHLYVCSYDNVTEQMAPYYKYLEDRCNELTNVTPLGSLTKQELADVMKQCDALVYPTPGPQQPDFEEVSCITAMEAMASGLPFISSDKGALSETCKDSGSILLELGENGWPDLQNFVDTIIELDKPHELKEKQLQAATRYTWETAAVITLNHIKTLFKKNRSQGAVVKQLMANSDIYALSDYLPALHEIYTDKIINAKVVEFTKCYEFAFKNTWEEHYKAYYEYEKERGVDYGPEQLDGNMRFEHVSGLIGNMPDGSLILDYGCAHGHYTINLAKRFPNKNFIGIDITKSNIDKANAWKDDEGLINITFLQGVIKPNSNIIDPIGIQDSAKSVVPMVFGLEKNNFDVIIAAEVIEHIGSPQHYVDTLISYLKDENSQMIITTPFGPWEAQGFKEHYPWRAHVHHFDRQDLADLWGHLPNYHVAVAPSGRDNTGDVLGSYITTFNNPDGLDGPWSNKLDYSNKFKLMKPKQTVSACLIVKDGEDTLKRCLDSIKGVADEIIICVDAKTTDRTCQVIDSFESDNRGDNNYPYPIIKVYSAESALEIGFDEARNASIKEASGDWILWIDADEILVHPQNIHKYLRNNQYDGYAIKQHHFSAEPVGVLKTDLPCRLFRNHLGVKFFGVVHEHPEKELNEGVGLVQLLPDVEIAHQGYTTESVRRKRFNRNITLLMRDREKYPDRILGKFLWMRDLAQMCKYEIENNGGIITEEMQARAKEGIQLWEELLEDNHLRMLVDGIEFYDLLAKILGNTFEFGFKMDTSKMNGGIHLDQAKVVHSHFANKDHALKLFNALFNEKVTGYDSKYF